MNSYGNPKEKGPVVQPQSMLDEIKKEVSEYSRTSEKFALTIQKQKSSATVPEDDELQREESISFRNKTIENEDKSQARTHETIQES